MYDLSYLTGPGKLLPQSDLLAADQLLVQVGVVGQSFAGAGHSLEPEGSLSGSQVSAWPWQEPPLPPSQVSFARTCSSSVRQTF